MSISNVYPNPSFGFGSLSLIFLLCFVSFSKPCSTISTALGNETDRLSLLKFKESVPGDPRGLLGSWNDSVHFCNWLGVKCGVRHQRVTSLDLEGYGFRGTLSPHIGNLSFLSFLNLRNNSFSGVIPPQLGNLFRLKYLSLTLNMLEGTIPVNLSYCSLLEILYLRNNKLIGTIPTELGTLANLVEISLSQNNLTGGIPPSLGNSSSLSGFDLSYNYMAGLVPAELGKLKKLSFFGIGVNSLSGIFPSSLFNLSLITTFAIASNQLKGTLPPTIGQTLPNLQRCSIGMNKFSGSIPESLFNASKLQILHMSINNFVGQVPSNIGNLPDLQVLNLASNFLGNYSEDSLNFITSLTNCSGLNFLSLSVNSFGGVLPLSVGNLSTNLSVLNLAENEISGNIPTSLGTLVNLITLNLNINLFKGVIPTSLGKLQNLQYLGLEKNALSGNIPSSLGNLTKIYALDLSDNVFLEGKILPEIADFQNLQYIDIANNRLSGSIPRDVLVLSSLILLNFSRNKLSGSLPVEVGKLNNIIDIDLSENNLTGEVPEAIRSCESVEHFDLHGNFFQGSLPSLVSLRSLQYLDLSLNNLTGKIPKDLEKLHFLMYLNLSFNHLEGEVPSKGVFGNTSALAIAGNTDLCGGLPELQLPRCKTDIEINQGKTSHLKLPITIVSVAVVFLLFSGFVIFYRRRRSTKRSLPTVSTIGAMSKVSYNMLYRATKEFSPAMLIGAGSFGCVYKATLNDKEENPVAVKVLNLQKKGAKKSFIAECKALRTIRHRNLVKVLTCCSSTDYNGNDFKALVFEYMYNGSLDKWLHHLNDEKNQSRCLSLIQRVNIAIDVASAIHYLHYECEQQIVHRDLKPSNVLLDSEMVGHVSDFGLARLILNANGFSDGQNSTTGIKGTIGYVAPEYATGSEPSKQGDTYSYGILLLEMFTGRRPTDEIFKDDFNLHNFVKMALPERLVQIVDSALLPREVDEMATRIKDATNENINYNDNRGSEIDVEQGNINPVNTNEITAHLCKCLASVLEIGLACSQESPNERLNMGEVIREFQRIKISYESVGIRGQGEE